MTTTKNSITAFRPRSYAEIESMSKALTASGYFTDVKSVSQAIVKVQAGSELGLPPFAAMTGIHIIKGKPALGANVLATLIKNDPRYNYKVREHTKETCNIEFFEDGESVGFSEFTADDARAAGTQNMAKFAKNMLFARALSNGAKWHTPGVFGGSPVYTPEELGARVDGDGDIIREELRAEDGEFEELEEVVDLTDLKAAAKALYGDDAAKMMPNVMSALVGKSKSADLTKQDANTVVMALDKKIDAIQDLASAAVVTLGQEWEDTLAKEHSTTFPLYNMPVEALIGLADKVKGAGDLQQGELVKVPVKNGAHS